MKKSINHLGCACNLPSNLDIKRFACPNCETRYERNPLVLRFFVVWIADTKEQMEAAKRPSRRLESDAWVNSGWHMVSSVLIDPTGADTPESDGDDPEPRDYGTKDEDHFPSLNDPTVPCCGRDAADCDCLTTVDDMPASWTTEGNSAAPHR